MVKWWLFRFMPCVMCSILNSMAFSAVKHKAHKAVQSFKNVATLCCIVVYTLSWVLFNYTDCQPLNTAFHAVYSLTSDSSEKCPLSWMWDCHIMDTRKHLTAGSIQSLIIANSLKSLEQSWKPVKCLHTTIWVVIFAFQNDDLGNRWPYSFSN